MKKILLFALVAIAVTSCKSPEQRMAEECLKQHLKCPSTLKVVEFSTNQREAEIDCDTMFHVVKVDGKRYSCDKYYYSVKSVGIDSIRTITRKYPAFTMCAITYDAQNLMGAMVREEASVVIEGGKAIIWKEWFNTYYYNTEEESYKESRTITDLSARCRERLSYGPRDCWHLQYDIQDYKFSFEK